MDAVGVAAVGDVDDGDGAGLVIDAVDHAVAWGSRAVMHPCRPRFGVRTDLRSCGTQRVGGLLTMAALHPPPT